MIRNCPVCFKEITYKNKVSHKKALKINRPCSRCANKERANRPEEKKRMQIISTGRTGEKNHFYQKTHNKETKQKISTKISEINIGKNNPMYGKTVYQFWVNKFGEDVADQKLVKLKDKQSKASSGKNNPMYGKPSPNGSGNGWSGWYKGWFFRSLIELTFMVNLIERFGFDWESAETNKWKIQYIDYKGTERNYFPDFILNGKYVVECKPKRLWNSDSVVKKKEAAKLFCKDNNLIYKLMDIGCLSEEKIVYLRNNNLIKFTDRYEQKFKERYA